MKNEKVTGIKSVDFKIKALGHGVVNWNGSKELNIRVKGKDKKVTNHSLPKLRGYSNITGHWDNGNPKYKYAEDIDFTKNKLYISQNCIRHHLFRDDALFDLQSPEVAENMDKLLCSITGLVRGYVIPKKEYKRTSALLLEDFVDKESKNGNFEQMGRSGSKEKEITKSGDEKSTTIFSKTTFGDTKYESYGSISIEQLQFISLDDTFSRRAMFVNNEKECKEIAEKITRFINEIGNTNQAKAEYHSNYVRRGAIFNTGEAGILLNEPAIDVLIKEILEHLKNLAIRQAKGYMYVDSIEVDYNDGCSGKDMMRIKTCQKSNVKKGDRKYAQYFEGRDKEVIRKGDE